MYTGGKLDARAAPQLLAMIRNGKKIVVSVNVLRMSHRMFVR